MLRIKNILAISLAAAMLFSISVAAEDAEVDVERQVNSNRYTAVEPDTVKVKSSLDTKDFDKLLSNDKLELWYREKTGAVRVVDKKSGYVWGELAEDKPENMNKSWSAFANSIIAFDYYDKTGQEKRTGVGADDFKTTSSVKNNVAAFISENSKLSLKIAYEVELNDDRIAVRFDSTSLEENGEFTVGKVYILPFLGSTQKDEVPGYMFVPDGCGALIRYSNVSSYLKGFDRRLFGQDFGLDSTEVLNDLKSQRINVMAPEASMTMGVYGIVHGVKQNAIFANITGGAEYASIVANPSGVTTDYNWAASKFTIRQKYQQPTSKSGAGIQVVQKRRNEVKAAVEFSFLTGDDADYVGMAQVYQRQLEKDGVLSLQNRAAGDIPLKVDFIVADREKGLIFNKTKEITSLEYAKNTVDELKRMGIITVDVGLIGWQDGGISGQNKKKVKASYEGGSKADIDALKSSSYRLSLYFDPITAKEPQIDIRRNGTVTMSQSPVVTTNENTYDFLEKTYYFNPSYVCDILGQANEFANNNGYTSVALDKVSSLLFGHYLSDKEVTRKQAMDMYIEQISRLEEFVDYIGMTDPNQYFWKYTDGFYSTPMVAGQYLYENDTVPFLQMVLKGYMDMYAPYSNVDFFTELDTLKHIDYGTYPSFLLTEEANHKLEKTTVYEYNSTSYTSWKDSIVRIYDKINGVLREVEGATVVGREVLRTGVVKISYSNNKQIYVNYMKSAITVDGITVEPSSAMVKEGSA